MIKPVLLVRGGKLILYSAKLLFYPSHKFNSITQ